LGGKGLQGRAAAGGQGVRGRTLQGVWWCVWSWPCWWGHGSSWPWHSWAWAWLVWAL